MLINLEWGVYYPPRRINLLISIKCDWFRLYNFQRNYKLHITWLKVRKYIPFIWDPFITTQSYKSYEYLGFTKCANVDKSSISDSCKIIQVHFFKVLPLRPYHYDHTQPDAKCGRTKVKWQQNARPWNLHINMVIWTSTPCTQSASLQYHHQSIWLCLRNLPH